MEERPVSDLFDLVEEKQKLVSARQQLDEQTQSWNRQAGLTLRSARISAGLTQPALASMASVTQPYVSEVENGGGVTPDLLLTFAESISNSGGNDANQDQLQAQARGHAEKARKDKRSPRRSGS